jgi:hypothetical protein
MLASNWYQMNSSCFTTVYRPVSEDEMDRIYLQNFSYPPATVEYWPVALIHASQYSATGDTHMRPEGNGLNGVYSHQSRILKQMDGQNLVLTFTVAQNISSRPLSADWQQFQPSAQPLPPDTLLHFPEHQHQLAPGDFYGIAQVPEPAPEPPVSVFYGQSDGATARVGSHNIPQIEHASPPEPHSHPAASTEVSSFKPLFQIKVRWFFRILSPLHDILISLPRDTPK